MHLLKASHVTNTPSHLKLWGWPKKNSQPQNENTWPFPRTFSPPPNIPQTTCSLEFGTLGVPKVMRVRQATDSGQQSSGSEESASKALALFTMLKLASSLTILKPTLIMIYYDCTSCTMFCQNASFNSQWNASGSCCSLYLKSHIQNHPRSSSPGLSKVRSACVSMSPLICGISTQALQTSESWPATYERRAWC